MLVGALCVVFFTARSRWSFGQGTTAGSRRASRRPFASVLAGFDYIRTRRRLLGVITLDLFVVMLGGATALLPIYARDILAVGPVGLGLLRSAPAVGALITIDRTRAAPGRAAYRRQDVRRGRHLRSRDYRFRTLQFLSAVADGLAMLGASDAISIVIRFSLVQIETPDEKRGRVSAINYLFVGSSNTLGDFESGWSLPGSARSRRCLSADSARYWSPAYG